MATIFVHSQIMNPVRNFLSFSKITYDEYGNVTEAVERKIKFPGKLINCILCMGFWCGLFWGGIYWHPFNNSGAHISLDLLFAGCLGSATTWLIYLLTHNRMQGK